MVKLGATIDLGSIAARRGGSSPSGRTKELDGSPRKGQVTSAEGSGSGWPPTKDLNVNGGERFDSFPRLTNHPLEQFRSSKLGVGKGLLIPEARFESWDRSQNTGPLMERRGRTPEMDELTRKINGSSDFDVRNVAIAVSQALAPKPLAEIKGFFGQYRWLSNFHYVTVKMFGEEYRTTEHAYQAAKHLDPEFRAEIARYDLPRDAMKAGRSRPPRPDWDMIKVEVMYYINLQKFLQEPLRTMLIETGDAYLEETNTWEDTFWGVCNGQGQNMLGEVLMLIRDELRQEALQVSENNSSAGA